MQNLTDLNTNQTPISTSKLKEYGKKSYDPFLKVFIKYKDELLPYLNALEKGLVGGYEKLNSSEITSLPEKQIGTFFKETSDHIIQFKEKLTNSNKDEVLAYIKQVAERHPGVLFGTSYVVGLFLGRLGLVMAHEYKSKDESLH